MQPLSHLESFVRSAETGSFSAAARLLGLSPAAVSKNVARLEEGLGVRLVQRSTRSLRPTDAGEGLLLQIGGGRGRPAGALANVSNDDGQLSGPLKVSMGHAFGRAY